MNRVTLLIAIAYISLALVCAGVYAASTAKFVDFADTQARFSSPARTWVSDASVSPSNGNWTIVARWRFDNPGRLPIVISSFLFLMFVDNRTSFPCDGSPTEGEFTRYGSFNLDRFTGPTVPPGGFIERTWTFWANGTDAAGVNADPTDGRYHLVFSDLRVVYYIANVDTFLRNDFGPRCHPV
jgi:hypothetical protein